MRTNDTGYHADRLADPANAAILLPLSLWLGIRPRTYGAEPSADGPQQLVGSFFGEDGSPQQDTFGFETSSQQDVEVTLVFSDCGSHDDELQQQFG